MENCTVCNGSGLSPGLYERLGIAQACGGCGGTGLRREVPAPDPEPELFGTGALDSFNAFEFHSRNLFDTPPSLLAEDYSGLSGVGLDMAGLRIDRRHSAELPNMLFGRTRPETATNLERIIDDYRRLALECDRALTLDRRAIDRKIAGVVKDLAHVRRNLGELAESARAYREAEALFTALGSPSDARACASNIAELELETSGDVDAALAGLHARLDDASEPLDVAELKLDVAELHFRRNDDFGAEEYLRDAKALLEPFEHRASGAATADALMASMQALLSGGAFEPGGIDETVRIRTLLSRLYRGLARVWPEQATDYQQRLLQLEGSVEQGSTENEVFSERMLQRLKELNDL
jgi:tetratricopeptide (TPR) repeat protein